MALVVDASVAIKWFIESPAQIGRAALGKLVQASWHRIFWCRRYAALCGARCGSVKRCLIRRQRRPSVFGAT